MELVKEIVTINKTSDTPVYLQITNAFIHNIRLGRFSKGRKLPGAREVANMLGINRMTVVAAYQELDAQGWIELLPRKGTFVKVNLPLLSPKKIADSSADFVPVKQTGFTYDEKKIIPVAISDFPTAGKLNFNDGFPDVRLAPTEALIRNMRSLSRLAANKKYLQYGGAQGTLFLRQALADFLSDTRGMITKPENILITRGAQMGIYITSCLLIKPGDDVVAGFPGYLAANLTFRQLGARVNYIPVDEGGMDISALEKICKKKKIKLVYVIPHHHNPTTVTLTPERRMRLLELAAIYNFAIVEDDYDYDFHYASKPIMPMASHDRYGNVIYIGTFTKTLAPAIRFGFLVGPEKFIQSATHLRKSIDTQGDSLMENAIASLYQDGTMARHIKRAVKLYKERRDNLCTLLQHQLNNYISFSIPDGGMAVWTNFLKKDLQGISQKALTKGLIIKDGTEYNTEKIKFNSVRLGFASLNMKEQEKAVNIIREICESNK